LWWLQELPHEFKEQAAEIMEDIRWFTMVAAKLSFL